MPRLLLAVCVLLIAGCLTTTTGEADDSPRDAAHNPIAASPTELDYMVLASMADAPRPLAMAYRSEVAVQLREQ